MPGLLQTTDYARALIREIGTTPADEIEDRVAARLGRQSLFGGERPARFSFFIHEFVLRLPVGGPAVMLEQLQHLLRKATRPYLTRRWASQEDHDGESQPTHFECFWVPLEAAHILQSGQGALLGRLFD